MIVLDTNVVSEFMQLRPDPAVISWLTTQTVEDFWTTTITEAELFAGAALLPEGKRKQALSQAIAGVLAPLENRIFSFDREAARTLSDVLMERRRAGLDLKWADGQIAAIARAYGADVATRDVDDFAYTGIKIINPWTA